MSCLLLRGTPPPPLQAQAGSLSLSPRARLMVRDKPTVTYSFPGPHDHVQQQRAAACPPTLPAHHCPPSSCRAQVADGGPGSAREQVAG